MHIKYFLFIIISSYCINLYSQSIDSIELDTDTIIGLRVLDCDTIYDINNFTKEDSCCNCRWIKYDKINNSTNVVMTESDLYGRIRAQGLGMEVLTYRRFLGFKRKKVKTFHYVKNGWRKEYDEKGRIIIERTIKDGCFNRIHCIYKYDEHGKCQMLEEHYFLHIFRLSFFVAFLPKAEAIPTI